MALLSQPAESHLVPTSAIANSIAASWDTAMTATEAGQTAIAILYYRDTDSVPDVPTGWRRVYFSGYKDSIGRLDCFARTIADGDTGISLSWREAVNGPVLFLARWPGISADPDGLLIRRAIPRFDPKGQLLISSVLATDTPGELVLAVVGQLGATSSIDFSGAWTELAYEGASGTGGNSSKASLKIVSDVVAQGTEPSTLVTSSDATGMIGLMVSFREDGQAKPAPFAWDDPTVFDNTITSGTYTSDILVPAGEVWTFENNPTITLDHVSIIVEGRFYYHGPADITHLVDNSTFEGATDANPLDVDVTKDPGVFIVRGDGQLDIAGTDKVSWNRTGDDVSWNADDLLISAPVDPLDFTGNSFTKGSTVPTSPRGRSAEIINLTRDFKIRGRDGAYTHIHLHSHSPQRIKNIEMNWVGPPGVLGRYPIHFHHAFEGSRGSVIEFNALRNCGNHAIVPHLSFGFKPRFNVVWKSRLSAFWWDRGDYSDDLDIEDNVVIEPQPEERLSGQDIGGYLLGGAAHLTTAFRRNVVAGMRQAGPQQAGFFWQGVGDVLGKFVFEDNVVHNVEAIGGQFVGGLGVWQNTATHPHNVDDTLIYNVSHGIDHGAYGSMYHYNRTIIEDADIGIIQHIVGAAPEQVVGMRADGYGPSFDGHTIRGARVGILIPTHNLESGTIPVLHKDCTFEDVDLKVELDERAFEADGSVSGKPAEGVGSIHSREDFVNTGSGTDLDPNTDFVATGNVDGDGRLQGMHPNSVIRVQNADGTAWRITMEDTDAVTLTVASIASFYEVSFETEPTPDLTFRGIGFEPSSAVLPGDTLTVFGEVENTGDTTEDFRVRVSIDTAPTAISVQTSTLTLAPGGILGWSLDMTIPEETEANEYIVSITGFIAGGEVVGSASGSITVQFETTVEFDPDRSVVTLTTSDRDVVQGIVDRVTSWTQETFGQDSATVLRLDPVIDEQGVVQRLNTVVRIKQEIADGEVIEPRINRKVW